MGYFVYIIKSKSTGKKYTGLTNNINRRLKEHNQKYSNTMFTKNLYDYQLCFCVWLETRALARQIEKYLKSGCGREFRDNLVKC